MVYLCRTWKCHGTSMNRRGGTFGRRACSNEILGVGQSSNVCAITGTHYFHQSNFYFKHHYFHPEKIYLLRIVCIDPASISVTEELFSSKQQTLRNNSLHPSQGWIQLPFQLDYNFSFIQLPPALYPNGRRPKVTYPQPILYLGVSFRKKKTPR